MQSGKSMPTEAWRGEEVSLDPSFEICDNTLSVKGELDPHAEPAFVDMLKRLAESDLKEIIVDLTHVHYISSLYARHLAQVAVDAQKSGRHVMVRASREVFRLMQLGGIDKLCDVTLAEQD